MSLKFAAKVVPAVDHGGGGGIAASPDGRYVALATDGLSAPGVVVWEWTPSGGFGAEYTPAVSLGRCHSVAWSPDGAYIAVGMENSPFIKVYPWNDPGFGSPVAAPASLPAGRVFGVEFSPAGTQIVLAHETSPRTVGYVWSGGFGAKLNVAGGLPGSGRDVSFHPSGSHVAIAHSSSPFISVFPWSSSGYGSKLANPSLTNLGTGLKVDFSDDGNALALRHIGTDNITVWAWSPGFGSRYSQPGTSPGGTDGVAFAPGSTHIAMGSSTLTDPAVFEWSSASGFGALVPSPDASGPVRDVAFTPAGNVLVVHELGNVEGYIASRFIVGAIAL